MALQIGAFRGFGERVTVAVEFENAVGLQTGAVVSVAGVPVGTVQDMRLAGDHARLVLSVDPRAEVRQDATARIRSRSVLGEKYVALERGTEAAPLAQSGDVIEAGRRQVEIDELVDTLGSLLAAVDPEALGEAGEAFAEALREDPERPARMLADLEVLLGNAADASEELPALAADTRRTLADARRGIGVVEARAVEAEALLARGDDLLVELGRSAERGPALIDEVEAATGDARRILAHLEGATDDLDQILDNLGALDLDAVRRLLREDGVRVRLFPGRVEPRGVGDEPDGG